MRNQAVLALRVAILSERVFEYEQEMLDRGVERAC